MENHPFNSPELPDKLYFKVGEVSEITEIPTYVLRFWETEFKGINPKRTPSGQRLYRKTDVELVLRIKYLLYERKFTIQGARQLLKTTSSPREKISHSLPAPSEFLEEIRKELLAIRDLLK